MKRIDFEYYWTEDQPVNGKVYGVEEILEDADMGGIDHVVLIAGPIPNPNNSGLAEFVEDEPRLIGCCQINPLHGAPAVKELETAATVWGMPILKLMSVGCNYDIFGQAPLPVLDKARELELVVNIHSGARHSTPAQIGLVAARYPELPIIMEHMGVPRRGQRGARGGENLFECPSGHKHGGGAAFHYAGGARARA